MQSNQKELLTQQEGDRKPVNYVRGALFIAIIALIISLLCLSSSIFFYQSNKKIIHLLIVKHQELQSTFQPKLNYLYKVMDEQQKTIDIMKHNQMSEKKNALLLAQEAVYLLTLAKYNLVYANNITLAQKLMVEANQKIGQMNDPNSIALQKSINDNLMALSTVHKIDIASLISRIAAISDQVSTLSNSSLSPPATKVEVSTAENRGWKQKLMNTFKSLRDIIAIRRLPEPISPLASLENQYSILGSVRLHLTQAQFAILYQDPTLYQNSLQEAKKPLQRFYAKNPKGIKLIESISELQKIEIKPPLPDLTNVLALLHTYIYNMQASLSVPMNNKPLLPTSPATTHTAPYKTNPVNSNHIPRALPS
jgi:uroporphyrin-3 C-methyltransferase